ncbi:MAG TPA: hypothetical protein PL056_11935 [bacterium]|nr:hypothetical protein [bacterium]
MKVAILIFILFLLSCNSSEKTNTDNLSEEDNESSDELFICFDATDFYINGAGNESCPCQNDVDRIKRSINDVTGSEKGNTMKIEEILYLEDRNEVVPKGDCGQENKCALTFKNYDRSLFKDSLIGKEWVLYLIEGFYGSVYGEYVSRDVQVIRHKDGTLIAASGTGIVNEDGEHEWDDKVWPSKLVPEIKAEQKVLSTCESFCVKFQSGEDGKPLGDWQYDHIIAPPVEITVEGKTPVIVKNGEVIRSEGYEYFVRDSVRVTEEDSDGYILSYGKKYKFDFFIVNTEALK